MDIDKAIAYARKTADEDPQLAAYMLRDLPEVQKANLSNLASSLASGYWGCSRNDVLGLIESLEKHLSK